MSHVTKFLTGTAIALSLALGGTMARAGDPDLIAFDWSSFQLPDLLATYVTQHGDMPTFSIFADDDEAFHEIFLCLFLSFWAPAKNSRAGSHPRRGGAKPAGFFAALRMIRVKKGTTGNPD